ncbi:hypothetical protein [uncultured Flavobacterium sp.]|uniref:hypothetical protein n=1 Tax=uncultured Flavobacterium sp. TaxID=165435 RepID=UPI0030C830D9
MKKIHKILIAFFVIISLSLFLKGKISGQKFDSEKWKYSNLSSEENWNLRWNMMNSLRNNYELKGKTKSEIISLLGKPENEIRNEMSYSLGYTGFGINTGTLVIFLNEKGIVKNLSVHQG